MLISGSSYISLIELVSIFVYIYPIRSISGGLSPLDSSALGEI